MGNDRLRILQIGAGSMGKRRLRDLSARPDDVAPALYDMRADRRKSAEERFGVRTFAALDDALAWGPEALVISTPPDQHQPYVDLALERGLHHFCEAHIWTPDFRRVEKESQRQGLVSASSNSMCFLPVGKKLLELARDRALGTPHAYQMCLSTWMPGWHPDEGDEFYARRRPTAAAREMVPFELLYLNRVFGAPTHVAGSVTCRGELPNVAEDTWCLQMRLEGGAAGQLCVLMASPPPYRAGCCFGTRAAATFDIVSGTIVMLEDGRRETIECGRIAQVLEPAYAEEIGTFVDAARRGGAWPYPYRQSATATAALAAAERSALTGHWEPVDPARQPAHVPSEALAGL